MQATFFSRQGRYRSFVTGVESDVRLMAAEADAVLVEGDYRGHYLVGGALPPVPLAELSIPPLSAERTLDFGMRRAGDAVTVDNTNYLLTADEPLVVVFGTAGEYDVSVDLLGYQPCRFTVTVP